MRPVVLQRHLRDILALKSSKILVANEADRVLEPGFWIFWGPCLGESVIGPNF